MMYPQNYCTWIRSICTYTVHVDLSGILLFSSWSHFGVRHSGTYMYASSELYVLCTLHVCYNLLVFIVQGRRRGNQGRLQWYTAMHRGIGGWVRSIGHVYVTFRYTIVSVYCYRSCMWHCITWQFHVVYLLVVMYMYTTFQYLTVLCTCIHMYMTVHYLTVSCIPAIG